MPINRIISPSNFDLPKINENIVLFFNLNHFFMFRDICQPTKVKSFGPSKRYNFEHQGKAFTAIGGFIGAPLAVITFENAISCGGKNFFTFGTAGWLSPEKPTPGLIRQISSALDQTGMAIDYGSNSRTIKCSDAGHKIVSTNSFYQLTNEKVVDYRQQDISLIDMEIAPLIYIVQCFRVNLEPYFLISDFVDTDFKWHNLTLSSEFLTTTSQALENFWNHLY